MPVSTFQDKTLGKGTLFVGGKRFAIGADAFTQSQLGNLPAGTLIQLTGTAKTQLKVAGPSASGGLMAYLVNAPSTPAIDVKLSEIAAYRLDGADWVYLDTPKESGAAGVKEKLAMLAWPAGGAAIGAFIGHKKGKTLKYAVGGAAIAVAAPVVLVVAGVGAIMGLSMLGGNGRVT